MKKGFLVDMLACKDIIARNKDREAGKVWLAVQTFVESGCYSSYRRAGELTRLSLQGYKDGYISNYMKVSEQTVRFYRMNISKQLYSLFGDGFFDLLSNYQWHKDEVTARVTSVNYMFLHSVDFLPNEVLVMLNNSKVVPCDDFSLMDCKKELIFLNRYCMQSLRDDFKKLDRVKLDYLIRMLDGLVGTPIDRYKVLSLVADLSDKEVLELTKSIYGTTDGKVSPSDVSATLEDSVSDSFRKDALAEKRAREKVDKKLEVLNSKLGEDTKLNESGSPVFDDTEVTSSYSPMGTAGIVPSESEWVDNSLAEEIEESSETNPSDEPFVENTESPEETSSQGTDSLWSDF